MAEILIWKKLTHGKNIHGKYEHMREIAHYKKINTLEISKKNKHVKNNQEK